MCTNDGGPAFPDGHATRPNGEIEWSHPGMSLRDWFAGQFVSSVIEEGWAVWQDSDFAPDPKGEFVRQENGIWVAVWANAPPSVVDTRRSLPRFRCLYTYESRVARRAYLLADAMLAARKS